MTHKIYDESGFVVASRAPADEITRLTARVAELEAAAHTMLSHHYNCRGTCPQYEEAVALLARTSDYVNDLFEDEISATLSQPTPMEKTV